MHVSCGDGRESRGPVTHRELRDFRSACFGVFQRCFVCGFLVTLIFEAKNEVNGERVLPGLLQTPTVPDHRRCTLCGRGGHVDSCQLPWRHLQQELESDYLAFDAGVMGSRSGKRFESRASFGGLVVFHSLQLDTKFSHPY